MIITLKYNRKCANHTCTNRVGEGTWAMILIPNPEPSRAGTRDIILDMCAPCGELLERAGYVIREGG